MKIEYHFNVSVFFMVFLMLCVPALGYSQAIERVTIDAPEGSKQYDVIETKRYQVVEVESLTDAPAQLPSVMEQAISDAKQDAAAHLNKTLWFSAGFFFPIGGTLISQWYQPFLPTGRVLGKSPEYIAFYYDIYKVETKKLQFRWSLIGCLLGTATVSGIVSIFD